MGKNYNPGFLGVLLFGIALIAVTVLAVLAYVNSNGGDALRVVFLGVLGQFVLAVMLIAALGSAFYAVRLGKQGVASNSKVAALSLYGIFGSIILSILWFVIILAYSWDAFKNRLYWHEYLGPYDPIDSRAAILMVAVLVVLLAMAFILGNVPAMVQRAMPARVTGRRHDAPVREEHPTARPSDRSYEPQH